MKKHLVIGLFVLIAQAVAAQPLQTSLVAQPTTCISSQFTATGDQYWKSMILRLTNNCNKTVDFQNATISFESTTAINTSFWGDFAPLSYPDSSLTISSQHQTNGNYLATLNLHFPSYPGANSKLPSNDSIQIRYGVSADNHLAGSVNVYLETPVETGSLVLQNASPKPTGVSQDHALIHLFHNGQIINNVQLPWASTLTLSELPIGAYSVAAENVSDSNGHSYQGNAQPHTFTLEKDQTINSTITYNLTQQEGKIAINLQPLPDKLAGYTSNPSVLITQNQTGNSITRSLNWDSFTTISQLQAGATYQFSTTAINYNGQHCAPIFSPTSLVASTTSLPATNLTYQCTQIIQDSVTLNVTGAPTNLTSLKINLTPHDNSTVMSQTIDLNNGNGSATVILTEGVIYTLSSQAVDGFSIHFSPQPLTASANAVVTISFSPENAETPLAINGQLKVCGTQLCNEQGNAIQLKGMSTHGLQWYGLGTCITEASLNVLSKNFKASVIRLSLYVQEDGYESNPTAFTQQVSELINEAYERGIYVIVDWHILNPGDPNYNLTRAKKFFTDIATIHKDKKNILYEIANEPNGVSWATIKNYADQLIPVIREIDANAPILIGTRGWSSLGVSEGSTYQEIVNNPVQFENIMYTFHFYAASHRDEYLSALDNASQVLPIFVTEFGTQTYSGDGANDFVMSDRYMQLMATRKIGWTNWNYSDDFRSGAIWKTNSCATGSWGDNNLKPAGVYIKNKITM